MCVGGGGGRITDRDQAPCDGVSGVPSNIFEISSHATVAPQEDNKPC